MKDTWNAVTELLAIKRLNAKLLHNVQVLIIGPSPHLAALLGNLDN